MTRRGEGTMAPKRGDSSSAKDSDETREGSPEAHGEPSASEAWENSPFSGPAETLIETTAKIDFDLPAPTETPPAPAKPEHPPEAIYADETFEEKAERLSRVERAVATVGINKDALLSIPVEIELDRHFRDEEEKERVISEKVAELKEMLENFAKLPEILNFQPGVTLIVGENGQGKSTLAKAFHYAILLRESTLKRGSEMAEKLVLESGGGSSGYGMAANDKIALASAGLAPEIAKTLNVSELEVGSHISFNYWDISKIMGVEHQRENEYSKPTGGYDEYGSWQSEKGSVTKKIRGSHRQTVDEILNSILDDLSRNTMPGQKEGGPTIVYLDEPETGMSPNRQRDLAEELSQLTEKRDDIFIVPTNSIVLYDSDLPRIDLEHPERGIHRPSEYPEDDDA